MSDRGAPTVHLHAADRSSPDPWVDSVWTAKSVGTGSMASVASSSSGVVFWRAEGGRTSAAIVGPESKASTAIVPADSEFFGIQLAAGVGVRGVTARSLVDSGIDLAVLGESRVLVGSRRLQIPGPDDAELFIDLLRRLDLLTYDPMVAQALAGKATDLSERSLQRRVVRATGMSRERIFQIDRARRAAELLTSGVDPVGVADALGFYDQPHLARALRAFVGRTAGQLHSRTAGAIALSGSSGEGVDQLDDPVGVRGGLDQS